jgi:hypothetical protein
MSGKHKHGNGKHKHKNELLDFYKTIDVTIKELDVEEKSIDQVFIDFKDKINEN